MHKHSNIVMIYQKAAKCYLQICDDVQKMPNDHLWTAAVPFECLGI